VGRAVAQFLHERGRRRLGVVAGDDERARRRTDAFNAEAVRLGLQAPKVVIVPAPTTLGSGRLATAELLRQPGGVDAVFCSSDLLALGVLTEARVQGIDVPRALAVVGFGDLDLSGDTSPALTTVRINAGAIGRHAADFIVARAEGRPVDPRVVDIGFSIVEREST
jgi:LacI family gluconate utilization system Gnt-I transcriptional repressor